MAEMMLRGVFDTLEEGSYVAEQAQLLEVLQVRARYESSCVGH